MPFVFALSVFVGHFAALFFDQLAEDVAFEIGGCAKSRDGLSDGLAIALTVFRSVEPVVRRHRSR